MRLFIFCTITVIESIGVLFAGTLNAIKSLADVGYKVNTDKLEDALNHVVDNERIRFSLVNVLIPIYNIISSVHFIKKVNDTKFSNVNLYKTKGILEEMTDEEKEQYFRNPTFLNALMISSNYIPENDSDLEPDYRSSSIKKEELTEEKIDCNNKLANDMKDFITLDIKKLTKEELISKKENILNQIRNSDNCEVKIELPENMGNRKEQRKMIKQMKDLLKYIEENEDLSIDSQIIEEDKVKTYKN